MKPISLFCASFIAFAFFGIASVRAADPAIPANVSFEKEIEYGVADGQHLLLNIAKPAKPGIHPAVLCIHGGGFRAGNRDSYNALIVKLAERGYVGITASYRFAPKYPFPAAVYDVKAAVRWAREHAKQNGIDPERIGVTGGSAGGHLAQFLGLTPDFPQFEGNSGNSGVSSKVSCVVNFYGPSDFTKSYGKSVDAAEVLPLFLGGNLEQQPKRHIEASPLYWVTPLAAPTLCVHGTKDNYVAFEQADWLVDKLKAVKVEATLLPIEGAMHGFKGDDAKKAEAALFEFFDSHLHPEK